MVVCFWYICVVGACLRPQPVALVAAKSEQEFRQLWLSSPSLSLFVSLSSRPRTVGQQQQQQTRTHNEGNDTARTYTRRRTEPTAAHASAHWRGALPGAGTNAQPLDLQPPPTATIRAPRTPLLPPACMQPRSGTTCSMQRCSCTCTVACLGVCQTCIQSVPLCLLVCACQRVCRPWCARTTVW